MSKAAELAALIGSQSALSNRNLVINGAMQVAQRGTSTSSITTGFTFPCVDRLGFNVDNAGTWTVSQSTDVPSGQGFGNSFKIDCTTADFSLAAADYIQAKIRLEANTLQSLAYNTSSAKSTTLSFWVKSAKTGTYIVEWLNEDASNKHIAKTYTIDSANTWEKKELTIPGDVSGVINNDNGKGMELTWWLGAGSNFTSSALQTSWGALDQTARAAGVVNLADSTSNDWYITGLQWEVGEQATPFEHRSFGDELARCRRYFERIAKSATQLGQSSDASPVVWSGLSRSGNSGNNQGMIVYETKRNNPTLSVSAASHFNGIYPISPFASSLSGFAISGTAGLNRAYANATNNASSAPTTDCGSMVNIGDSSGYLDIDAEL
jgi:hypothetical protein